MKKKCKAKVVARALGSLLVGTILLTTIMAHTPALAQLSNYNPQGLEATTLEEVLALPDEEIDLATAIMILYKEWDASFDVAGSLEEIDRMALELEARISPGDSPEKAVSLINQYLFEGSAYSGLAYPGYMRKLEDSALPSVIENKKGNCLGLSLLYLALAERLGLPFYGVAVPEHIFVRYDDGRKRINIETTSEGRKYRDSTYEIAHMLHPTYRDYNFYLRNLFKREMIGVFLSNFGIAYYRKGMYHEAIAAYQKASDISPNHAEVYGNLGVVYGTVGMYDEAIVMFKKALIFNPNAAGVHYDLGIAYYIKGMYDEAIAEYKRAVVFNPNDTEAHYGLSLAYYAEGEYSLAIEHCDRAIELGYRVHPEFLEALKPYRGR